MLAKLIPATSKEHEWLWFERRRERVHRISRARIVLLDCTAVEAKEENWRLVNKNKAKWAKQFVF